MFPLDVEANRIEKVLNRILKPLVWNGAKVSYIHGRPIEVHIGQAMVTVSVGGLINGLEPKALDFPIICTTAGDAVGHETRKEYRWSQIDELIIGILQEAKAKAHIGNDTPR